jgi:hypothetical protein
MDSVGGPLVLVPVVDETGPDRIEIDVRSCDGEVTLGFHRPRVISLLEELPCGLITLVANLGVPLRDTLHERSESVLFEGRPEQMNVVRHEAQCVRAHVRARELTAHERDKEEIVTRVREQSSSVVAAQNDVMRNAFQDLAGCSWHAPFIGHSA